MKKLIAMSCMAVLLLLAVGKTNEIPGGSKDISIFLRDGSRYELSQGERKTWDEFIDQTAGFQKVKRVDVFVNSNFVVKHLVARVEMNGELFPRECALGLGDNPALFDLAIKGVKRLLASSE